MKTKLIFILTLIGHLALAQQDSLSFELPESLPSGVSASGLRAR